MMQLYSFPHPTPELFRQQALEVQAGKSWIKYEEATLHFALFTPYFCKMYI